MIFKQKEDSIILIITSLNQLNNILSYLLEKKLFYKKKIYLIILNETISDELILIFKQYINNFSKVEVLDLRRKSLQFKNELSKINFFKIILYYTYVIKKIFQIKKTYRVKYFVTGSKAQFPTIIAMTLLFPTKIFLIEDGLGDYVFTKKKILYFYFYTKNF